MKTKAKQFIISALVAAAAMQTATAQTVWYDPMDGNEPNVCNRAWNTEIGKEYSRLPKRAHGKVSQNVYNLSKNSAGLFIRFVTKAPEITVEYEVTGGYDMNHMPATGVSGLDLYATDANGRELLIRGLYSFGKPIKYEYKALTYENSGPDGYEYRLYLPLYNTVKNLKIGVDKQYPLRFTGPDRERQIVVYGTSIAQGGCASRPGMAWTNILQRKLRVPVVNLGFSGSAFLDAEVFKLMAETDARVFVIDCLPNMTTRERAAEIKQKLAEGIKILRNKSNAPILVVEHDGYMGANSGVEQCSEKVVNKLQREAFDKLKKQYKGLYYLSYEELALSQDSQVDGVHASDLGMQQYADAYARKLKGILRRTSNK